MLSLLCFFPGNVVTIKLSENQENVLQTDQTYLTMIVETHFQVDFKFLTTCFRLTFVVNLRRLCFSFADELFQRAVDEDKEVSADGGAAAAVRLSCGIGSNKESNFERGSKTKEDKWKEISSVFSGGRSDFLFPVVFFNYQVYSNLYACFYMSASFGKKD